MNTGKSPNVVAITMIKQSIANWKDGLMDDRQLIEDVKAAIKVRDTDLAYALTILNSNGKV